MMEIKAKGINEAAKTLEEFANNIEGVITKDLEKLGQEVLALANSLTPVRTGYLQSRNQLEIEGKRIKLFNDAQYAPFVHDGTSKQEPRPFLSQAAQALKAGAAELIGADLAKAYQAAKGKGASS